MGTKLYVGNLPFEMDDLQLRQLVVETGKEPADIAMISDRMTGRPRGFAFVTMQSDDDARAVAEALNGKEHGGRNLVVNEAEPRAPRAPRPISDRRTGFGSGPPPDAFKKQGKSRRKRRHKRML